MFNSVTMERGEEQDVSSFNLGSLSPNFKKDRFPLLLTARRLSRKGRAFLDISTKEFHKIVCPDFKDARFIYSKGGWLLMHRKCLFLLNPSTGMKYKLPKLHTVRPGILTFSVTLGVPDRVIHVLKSDTGFTSEITVSVACPGDGAWKVHVYKDHDERAMIGAVVLVGTVVMCLYNHGPGGVALDLSDGSWRVVPLPNIIESVGTPHFIESGGEVVKTLLSSPRFETYKFWKLDMRSMGWVDMNDFELENTSWFLDRYRSFCARGEGKKVYTLDPNRYVALPIGPELDVPVPPDSYVLKLVCQVNVPGKLAGTPSESNIYVHNLEDGTTESLLPNRFIGGETRWVDPDLLGCCCDDAGLLS